jgi:hypothetical protein
MTFPSLSTVVVGLLRRSYLLAVATIVICSAFAAHALDAVAAARAIDGTPRLPPAPPPPPPHPRTRPSGEALVVRDMFCSACAPSFVAGRGDAEDVPRSTHPPC